MSVSSDDSGYDLRIADDSVLSLLQHLSAPAWVFDVDRRRILWANPAALDFWSADSDAELLSRDLSDLSPQVALRLEQYRTDCVRLKRSFRETWTLFPDDSPLTADFVVAPFPLQDGRIALLLNVDSHVETRSGTESLNDVQALLHTSAMIGLYSCNWQTQYLNPAARAAQGTVSDRFDEHLANAEALSTIELLLQSADECELELDVHTSNGPARHAMTIRRARSPLTGEEARVVTATDVTQRYAAELEVKRLAFTDSLTGLANRVDLSRDIERRLREGHDDSSAFAVLFLDLDRFKLVNDSLGHSVGDALLVQVAERLLGIVSPTASVARLGGDEFVVLDTTDAAGRSATGLARSILQAMDPVFEVKGHRLRARPSIGICLSPAHGCSAEELMRHADIAMYAAKSSQNGFAIFDGQMNSDARKRLDIENGLARALERDQFEIHYQPKVRSATGDTVGFEALLRWNDPRRGLVPPMEFIGIAEDTGQIVAIGEHVMRQAMLTQKAWADAGRNLEMSINVSAKQFVAGALLETVTDCLAHSGAEPSKIELEITESVLLGDAELVALTLGSISRLGVRVAIDDFGTGYSNLAYLRHFPLDCLKIDKAFISDPDQIELLELILEIGSTLDLKTVAEGVETAEQADWLARHGCDELQGYLFAHPMPADEVLAWLDDHSVPMRLAA